MENLNKIIYVSGSEIPSSSANTAHVLQMCESLSKLIEVDVFVKSTKYDIEKFKRKNTNLNNLNFLLFKKSTFIRWLLFFSRNKYNFYYMRNIKSFLTLLLLKRNNIILELHHLNFNVFEKLLLVVFFKFFKKFKITVISNQLKKDLILEFKINPNNIFLLRDAGPVISEYKKTNSLTTIGYIGSFNKGKGVELIINIAKSLKDYNFLLYGDSSNFDDKNLPSNVRLMGFVNVFNLKNAYDTFDIALAPYSKNITYHGSSKDISKWISPLKIFESWSFGKLILVSDLDSIREFCDETNVVFCEPEKISSWVKKITNLELNKVNIITKNAFNLSQNQYSWTIRAKLIMDLYEI